MSLLVAGGFRGRSVLSFLGAPGHSSRIPWLVRGWKDIFGPWLVGPGIVSCLWFFFLLLHLSPNSCSPLHAASGAARAWVPPSQRAAIAPDHHLPTFDVLAHRTR